MRKGYCLLVVCDGVMAYRRKMRSVSFKTLSIAKIKQRQWYVNEMSAGRQTDRGEGGGVFYSITLLDANYTVNS